MRARDEAGPVFRAFAADTARAVRFFSRLPLPALPFEADPHGLPRLSARAAVVPVAGVAIGLVPALVLCAGLRLGLGPGLAAALSVAAMAAVTGALHEDGLADAADGLFGGATPERRLAIMKDSRIGSFGTVAVSLALALRIVALATLAQRLPVVAAAAAVLIAAAVSRSAALLPLAMLPPANAEGAARSIGRPSGAALGGAGLIAGAISLALGLPAGLPLAGLALMLALAALAGWLLARLARRLIGGQTGDVAGAAQQVAEVLALIGLLLAVEP